MTAAAILTESIPARPRAWRPLLWLVPLTGAWFALSCAAPGLQASGIPSTVSRVSIHILIALGLWLGLERTELTMAQRRNVWLAVMITLTLWFCVIWNGAINGVFRPGASPVPLVPVAIFLPVIIGAPILLRSKRIGEVLDAMPPTWLVALQVYRVFGMTFLVGWLFGLIPGIFALPAGTGDVITGLVALPVAYMLASGDGQGRAEAVAWNVFGLLDFAVAISLGLITSPGPLQLIVPDVPNTTAGVYPTVLIPAFAVPSSILLHLVSLRQLSRRASVAR
jgi:hypothetical protein